MLKFRHILLAFCLCILCGCSGYLQKDDSPDLVVEGWIEDGGYPVVMVSTSVLASELPAEIDSLSDHMVRWARVKVSDGEKEVFLTGMRSKKHIPPYIYTTSEIKGEAGKSYTLTVDYGTAHASAVTTIPKTVRIDDVRVEERADTLRKVYVQFTDPADEKNYYRMFVRVDGKDMTWFPALFGLSNDSGFQGASEMQLHRGYGNNMIDYFSDFREGESVSIKLNTCTEEMFEYWKSFDNNMFYGRTPFFPAKENAHGNVAGAYGYWAGYGSYSLTVLM